MATYKKRKKEGFVARMVMGAEKSEGYARASLPSNRWELFWDILKNRLGRLVVVNLLMCLFFIPLALLFLFRYTYLANLGMQYPYANGFGVGYQALVSMIGLNESAIFTANLVSFLFMPIALSIAAVGISGGAYVMRNVVWTEGVFVANDFWHGIKANFKTIVLVCLSYSLIFYISVLGISLMNTYLSARTGLNWLFWIVKIVCIVVLAFYTIMCLHMIPMAVTYDVKFFRLVKNSFYTTSALLVQNIFFIALGLVPFALFLFGDFFATISVLVAILIGFSIFLLVWTNYCQWIYDKYINDRVEGAKKNRGIYQKVKETDNFAQIDKVRSQLEYASLSSLSSKPIKPITDEELQLAELPESFTRGDIEKLNQSRKALYEDNERYIKEHLTDQKYAQIEEAKEKLDSEEQERLKRIEQAKKELAKRKKNKK